VKGPKDKRWLPRQRSGGSISRPSINRLERAIERRARNRGKEACKRGLHEYDKQQEDDDESRDAEQEMQDRLLRSMILLERKYND